MRIFISWSGNLSRKVAELLNEWMPNVIQSAEPWFSPEDIAKGEIWFSGINDALANTSYGILCITKENLNAPWVLFEAGALCKGLSKNRVCPLLIDLEPNDLKPPLAQFNATRTTKEEIGKLLQSINGMEKEKALTEERLQKSFERWWPDFEKKMSEAFNDVPLDKIDVRRTVPDMTEEILETVRSIQKSVQGTGFGLPHDVYSKPTIQNYVESNLVNANPSVKTMGDQMMEVKFHTSVEQMLSTEGIQLRRISGTTRANQTHTTVVVSKIPSAALRADIVSLAARFGKAFLGFQVEEAGTVAG